MRHNLAWVVMTKTGGVWRVAVRYKRQRLTRITWGERREDAIRAISLLTWGV